MNDEVSITLTVESNDGSNDSDEVAAIDPDAAITDAGLLFAEVLQKGAYVAIKDGVRMRTPVEDAPRPETLALALGFGDIGKANADVVKEFAVQSDLFVYVDAGVSSRYRGVFVDWDELKDASGVGDGYIDSVLARKKAEPTDRLNETNIVEQGC